MYANNELQKLARKILNKYAGKKLDNAYKTELYRTYIDKAAFNLLMAAELVHQCKEIKESEDEIPKIWTALILIVLLILISLCLI